MALRVFEVVPLELSDVVLVGNLMLLVVNIHEVLGAGIKSNLLSTIAGSGELLINFHTVLIECHKNVEGAHFKVLLGNQVGMEFTGSGSLISESLVLKLILNLVFILLILSCSNNVENHIVLCID